MKQLIGLVGIALACVAAPCWAQDAAGSQDHPLFNRMPGYEIHRYEEKTFDSLPFHVVGGKEVQVEGRTFEIHYSLKSGAKEPSRVEILRNYENAVTRIGGSVLWRDDDGNAYLKAGKDGKEIWAHVNAYITDEYTVWIVEKQAMTQNIVADAKALAGGLATDGHAAVYGIYFDTAKAVVKPESEAALGEIAKLLQAEPGLKVLIVGHTDNVGGFDGNLKLAQARADAVVQALTGRFAVAAARLRACAAGAMAPVASNDAEAGRAKNRRVELVKQ